MSAAPAVTTRRYGSNPRVELVASLKRMREQFGCDVDGMPLGVGVFGWDRAETRWLGLCEGGPVEHARFLTLVGFIDKHMPAALRTRPWWSLACVRDGWRERIGYSSNYVWSARPVCPGVEWAGAPGELPVLSATQPFVLSFARQLGDPSAVLVPEPHYLRHFYIRQRVFLPFERRPWMLKKQCAIFCGSDHGEPSNLLSPDNTFVDSPRRRLAKLVERNGLPVNVRFDGKVSRRHQIACVGILDVDGFVRTWDAWAWKLRSGSVVLSQDSIWETFFTRKFAPWEHFVPLANDLADLGEKVEWCLKNSREARRIAARGRHRATQVYRRREVARELEQTLVNLLGSAHT